MGMGNRPPYETFKRATCRGSLKLGTACGACEKCEWENARFSSSPPVRPETDPDCVCAETSVRNCPVHGNAYSTPPTIITCKCGAMIYEDEPHICSDPPSVLPGGGEAEDEWEGLRADGDFDGLTPLMETFRAEVQRILDENASLRSRLAAVERERDELREERRIREQETAESLATLGRVVQSLTDELATTKRGLKAVGFSGRASAAFLAAVEQQNTQLREALREIHILAREYAGKLEADQLLWRIGKITQRASIPPSAEEPGT